MSELKLPAASGGGSISIKGPSSSSSDVDLLDTSGNLKLSDNQKVKLGTGDDLEIYHNGSHSYIKNTGTGNLYIEDAGIIRINTDSFAVQKNDGSESILTGTADGAVELYHNNVKKWETTANGCQLTGQLDIPDGSGSDAANHIRIGNSFDCRIYHDGTDTYINNRTGKLRILSDDLRLENTAGDETLAKFANGGACELRYNDSIKLATTSAGGTLTGDWAGKVGLQEADEWRITSNVSSSDGSFTANWERSDTLGNGYLGTGMSQSGGIWTFPKTGIWLIIYNATASHTDYDRRYVLNRIRGTTDNSNYDNLVDGYGNIMDVPSDATYTTVHCSYIFDVTNTSLCKVSFHMQADGAVTWLGATDRRYTGATFIRLGDT